MPNIPKLFQDSGSCPPNFYSAGRQLQENYIKITKMPKTGPKMIFFIKYLNTPLAARFIISLICITIHLHRMQASGYYSNHTSISQNSLETQFLKWSPEQKTDRNDTDGENCSQHKFEL